MRSAVFAEWLLARFTQRPRAAAIVGDLQESVGAGNRLAFWRFVLGVLCSLAWRPVAAFLLVAFGGDFTLNLLQKVIFHSTQLSTGGMHDAIAQRSWASMQAAIATCFWVTAFYCVTRFGMRDVMSRLSAAFALLATLAVCFWWHPWVPSVAWGAAGVLLLAAMSSRKSRLGVIAVSVHSIIQASIFLAEALLSTALIGFYARHAGFASVTRIVKIWSPVSGLLFVWLICAACARVHQRMLEIYGETAVVSIAGEDA